MNRDLLRVLVLEASDADYERVTHAVASAGRNVTFERATNQAQFEAALKWGKADLILADHHAAAYPGDPALEAAVKALPGVPYIIVSGPIGEDQAADCLHAGAADFVRKDRLERLAGAIDRALAAPARATAKSGAELGQDQKMEFVGKLAGSVAQDFNNLLTVISGHVSMLLDRDGLPPGSNEALKRVYTASRQATGIVSQLLLFSWKRNPRREVVDLNAEVESISTRLGLLLGEAVAVGFKASPEATMANVDPNMLEQALMMLALNARDAMPKGGRLDISVEKGPSTGRSAPAHKGIYACISVRDTGGGIPADVVPKLFTPFFTTKEEGRGMGLGLATAQDIIRRHDGWIDLETQAGAGTVVRIYLPLSSGEFAARSAQPTGEPKKAGKGVILLVEDEIAVREFAAAVLQQEGYTLLQAKSGENALEVWRWHSARIDLLLTDVVMPGDLSGPQLATRLRAEKPGLKAVFATGYSEEIVGEQSPGSGSLVVLSKPYTPRSLLGAVREALAPKAAAP